MAVSSEHPLSPPFRWGRRLWGIDPRSVEVWAEDIWRLHVGETAALLGELREVRDELAASESVAREAAERASAAEALLAQLESAQLEREGRYRVMREEALAAVADAWAELQTIEARTKLQVEQAYAQWRDEEVRLRRHRERERQEWQEVIDGLRGRQFQAIDGVEALARDLLDYAVALRDRAAAESAAERTIAETPMPPLEFYWHDVQAAPSTPPAGDHADRDALTGGRVTSESSPSPGYADAGASSRAVDDVTPRESDSTSRGNAGHSASTPIPDEG